MPSERSANEIRRSLVEGERFEDFAWLYDALVFLRRPYQPDPASSENVVGRIICVLFPDKPDQYKKAMQAFRLGFAGVEENPELQAEFQDVVRRNAMTIDRTPIVYRPSLYFYLSPRLRESRTIRELWY
jgi:hypothetical protein